MMKKSLAIYLAVLVLLMSATAAIGVRWDLVKRNILARGNFTALDNVQLGDAATDALTMNAYLTQLRIGTGSTFGTIGTVGTDELGVEGASEFDGIATFDSSVTLGDEVADKVTANAYFTQLRIGTGTTFGEIGAVGADELGVEGNSEFDGLSYFDSTVTLGSSVADKIDVKGYCTQVRIGTGATFGNIGTVGADELGVEGNTEIDGTTYLDGPVQLGDNVADAITATGYFTQLRIGTGTTFPSIGTVGADELGVEGDAEIEGNAYVNRNLRLGTSASVGGRVLMYVTNLNGSALAEGDVTVWDATTITVENNWNGSALAAGDIDDRLTDDGGYFSLYINLDSGTVSTDTLVVRGTELSGGASYELRFAITDALSGTESVRNSTTGEPYQWSQVDSMTTVSFTGQMDIIASPVLGVVACDGANRDIAGVAIGAIADNAQGWICTHGVTKATVDAASTTATPGTLLIGASGGDFATDAAADSAGAAKYPARSVQYNDQDNALQLVFVDAM